MKIEQLYTKCLAEAAYYITSGNEAIVVDPLRETQPYLDRLERDGIRLKYIFETHFHADFVSGHVDLAQKTGATIVYGPTDMKPGFEAYIGHDNEVFHFGNAKVKLIHTPGHTLESSCFLLIDEKGDEQGLLTGDTLFIGDVGRPDLAQHVIADLTQDKLARMLYRSLRDKIMPLSDDLIIYPNHGAGSACGKNMSKETTDLLGIQKRTNYALNPNLSEDEFVEALLDGLTTPPAYFPKNVALNINGYESLDTILERGLQAIAITEFETLCEDPQILILDTRTPEEFSKGFIPNSLNIGLNGNFAPWVGELISDINQSVVLICNEGTEQEAVIRLSRIGYDNTIGFLEGGFNAWKANQKESNSIERIDASQLEDYLSKTSCPLFDIRKRNEHNAEHVLGAQNIPLNELKHQLDAFPKDIPFVLHCAGGYRSMMAASILQQNGYYNFKDVRDGFEGIKKTTLPLSQYVCPTSLL